LVVGPALVLGGLGGLGFGAGGIAAGSIAAGLQTATTAAGSWFALAQSAAALGTIGTGATVGVSTGFAAAGAAVGHAFDPTSTPDMAESERHPERRHSKLDGIIEQLPPASKL